MTSSTTEQGFTTIDTSPTTEYGFTTIDTSPATEQGFTTIHTGPTYLLRGVRAAEGFVIILICRRAVVTD